MNQTSHITTLRQTHRAAATLLPVLTATLTVAGAMIAAMEARAATRESAANSAAEAEETAARDALTPTHAAQGHYRRSGKGARRMTARAYIATLVGHTLLVALGVALVCSLIYAASATGRVGQAILLTALILLALYLTEKVARRA